MSGLNQARQRLSSERHMLNENHGQNFDMVDALSIELSIKKLPQSTSERKVNKSGSSIPLTLLLPIPTAVACLTVTLENHASNIYIQGVVAVVVLCSYI